MEGRLELEEPVDGMLVERRRLEFRQIRIPLSRGPTGA